MSQPDHHNCIKCLNLLCPKKEINECLHIICILFLKCFAKIILTIYGFQHIKWFTYRQNCNVYLLYSDCIRWHDHIDWQCSYIKTDSLIHKKGKHTLCHSLVHCILFYKLHNINSNKWKIELIFDVFNVLYLNIFFFFYNNFSILISRLPVKQSMQFIPQQFIFFIFYENNWIWWINDFKRIYWMLRYNPWIYLSTGTGSLYITFFSSTISCWLKI